MAVIVFCLTSSASSFLAADDCVWFVWNLRPFVLQTQLNLYHCYKCQKSRHLKIPHWIHHWSLNCHLLFQILQYSATATVNMQKC